MAADNTTPNPRHYVVVVHGMGESKLNETSAPVVQRFAEARQKRRARKILLPASLSSQSVRKAGMGQGWTEYNGIPVDPDDDTGEFDGSPATDSSGRNFRFVEMYWSDILQAHQERYASPVEKWSKALLERLETYPDERVPTWAKVILNTVVDTALPLKKIVALKYPALTSLVFDGFLGDVHLYGDYARTRGRAVRRFHRVLDEICVRDFIDWSRVNEGHEYQPLEFTVIAHSLGSILSFDALVYSRLTEDVRKESACSAHPLSSLPFAGYTFKDDIESKTWAYLKRQLCKQADDSKCDDAKCNKEFNDLFSAFDKDYSIPKLYWQGRVKNFVTLGGPIDKYLVLWQKNYTHMGGLDNKDIIQTEQRITHYNLCDEQDPVGHHLNVARNTGLYKEVFDTDIPASYTDAVYRRYAVPGVAHTRYFEDEVLFNGIVKEVIDGWHKHPEEEDDHYTEQNGRGYFISPPFRDATEKIYGKTLEWAYFRLPFILSLVTTALIIYSLSGLGIFGGQGTSGFGINHAAAFIVSVLLWIMPQPMARYLNESRPNHPEQTSAGGVEGVKLRHFGRGIFANLIKGMVQWRIVILAINRGLPHTQAQALTKNEPLGFSTAGNFKKHLKKRILYALMIFVFGFLLVWKQDGGMLDSVAKVLMLTATIYTVTMAYVSRCFKTAKARMAL